MRREGGRGRTSDALQQPLQGEILCLLGGAGFAQGGAEGPLPVHGPDLDDPPAGFGMDQTGMELHGTVRAERFLE
ncbi:MAG: hypothetical protein ACKO0M_12450 [Cyanobium sp.]